MLDDLDKKPETESGGPMPVKALPKVLRIYVDENGDGKADPKPASPERLASIPIANPEAKNGEGAPLELGWEGKAKIPEQWSGTLEVNPADKIRIYGWKGGKRAAQLLGKREPPFLSNDDRLEIRSSSESLNYPTGSVGYSWYDLFQNLKDSKEHAIFRMEALAPPTPYWPDNPDWHVDLSLTYRVAEVKATQKTGVFISPPKPPSDDNRLGNLLESVAADKDLTLAQVEAQFIDPYGVLCGLCFSHQTDKAKSFKENLDFAIKSNLFTNECGTLANFLFDLTTRPGAPSEYPKKAATIGQFIEILKSLEDDKDGFWYCKVKWGPHAWLLESIKGQTKIYQCWQQEFSLASKIDNEPTRPLKALHEKLSECAGSLDKWPEVFYARSENLSQEANYRFNVYPLDPDGIKSKIGKALEGFAVTWSVYLNSPKTLRALGEEKGIVI